MSLHVIIFGVSDSAFGSETDRKFLQQERSDGHPLLAQVGPAYDPARTTVSGSPPKVGVSSPSTAGITASDVIPFESSVAGVSAAAAEATGRFNLKPERLKRASVGLDFRANFKSLVDRGEGTVMALAGSAIVTTLSWGAATTFETGCAAATGGVGLVPCAGGAAFVGFQFAETLTDGWDEASSWAGLKPTPAPPRRPDSSVGSDDTFRKAQAGKRPDAAIGSDAALGAAQQHERPPGSLSGSLDPALQEPALSHREAPSGGAKMWRIANSGARCRLIDFDKPITSSDLFGVVYPNAEFRVLKKSDTRVRVLFINHTVAHVYRQNEGSWTENHQQNSELDYENCDS